MAQFVFMLTHGDRTVEQRRRDRADSWPTPVCATSGSRTSARTRRDSVS